MFWKVPQKVYNCQYNFFSFYLACVFISSKTFLFLNSNVVFFYLRSRLCDLRRGPHLEERGVKHLQSDECHQDQAESGADWHPAAEQPQRV